MPRKLAGEVDVIDAEEVADEKPKKAVVGSLFVKRLWDGDAKSLPETTKDKKGNQKNGEPRFMLHRGVGRYELLSVYRARGGVKTRLVRMLIDSAKRPRDRQIIVALKKAGAHID